jgi:hypothetical protein
MVGFMHRVRSGVLVMVAAAVLVIPLELRATPPYDLPPDDVPTSAPAGTEPDPESIASQAKRTPKPERVKKTGFGRIIAGTVITSFGMPFLIVSSMLLADFPNVATGGIFGFNAMVMVSGVALIGTGAESYKYSPCRPPKAKQERTGVGMIISGTALTSLGASSLILGGVGVQWSSGPALVGTFLGVGATSAVSGVALLVTGAVRRKHHHPCFACTRLSPVVSFDPQIKRVGIMLRF